MGVFDGLGGRFCPSLDDTGNGTSTLHRLDASGEIVSGGTHGTLTNMELASDWQADTDFGGVRALALDGVNEYIAVGKPITDFSEFSVATWVKPVGANSSKIVLGQRDAEGIGWWELINRASGWRFEVKKGDGSAEVYSPYGAYTNGVWQHVAGVFTGSWLRLYVNGFEAGSGTAFSGAIPAPTVAASIGSISGISTILCFSGSVDDSLFFNQAISADTVAELASSRGYLVSAASGSLRLPIRTRSRLSLRL